MLAADDVVGQRIERPVVEMAGGRDGRGGVRPVRHPLENFGAQQRRGAVVHLRELRRDPGLEREPAQQPGAEGVDRLDP